MNVPSSYFRYPFNPYATTGQPLLQGPMGPLSSYTSPSNWSSRQGSVAATGYYGSVSHPFQQIPATMPPSTDQTAPDHIPIRFNEDSYRPYSTKNPQSDSRISKRYFSSHELVRERNSSHNFKKQRPNCQATQVKDPVERPKSTPHSSTKSHTQSPSKARLPPTPGTSKSSPSKAPDANVSTANKSSTTFCDLCRVQCSGKESYLQHLAGARHRKTISTSNSNESASAGDLLIAESSGNDASIVNPVEQDVTKSQSLNCDLCRVTCSGMESYQQHLAGARHSKAIKASKIVEAGPITTSENPSAASSCINESPIDLTVNSVEQLKKKEIITYDCKLCRIKCSSKEALESHLVGAKHRKTEQNLSHSSSHGQGAKFNCDICSISCSGPQSYKEHLIGSKHAKAARLAGGISQEIPCDTPLPVRYKPIEPTCL